MPLLELEDESIAVERTPIGIVSLTINENGVGAGNLARTSSATMTSAQAVRLAALLMCAATGGIDIVGWLKALEIIGARKGAQVPR